MTDLEEAIKQEIPDWHPEVQRLVQAEVKRLRTLVTNLFLMVDQDAWRATGGDDGQGHYEGDYRSEQLAEEINSWKGAS